MNVLITGVSRGLGLKTTESLLKNGSTVYGISRSKSAELEELLTKFPEKLNWLEYDLSNSEKIRPLVLKNWIGFNTLISREVGRFFSVYRQTVLPGLISSALYILIFGF